MQLTAVADVHWLRIMGHRSFILSVEAAARGERIRAGSKNRARRHGQLWFNAALEFAPFPVWEIPEAARDAATQLSLLLP
jgi:hypothetical protein